MKIELDEHCVGSELIALILDAFRYRWLRKAGAWESEIGMDELSKDPVKFDAAVDKAIYMRKEQSHGISDKPE